MRYAWLVFITVPCLAGCMTETEQFQSVEARCPQVWPNEYSRIKCLDDQDRPIFRVYEGADAYAIVDAAFQNREQLAAMFDAGKISREDYSHSLTVITRNVAARIAQVRALDAQRREQFMQAILAGVAAGAQARANADQAALEASQQHPIPMPPPEQHTVCNPDPLKPSQLNCITTSY